VKITARNRFTKEVATSSLNDIMFFLLLFFLIVSTVANPNVIKVMLPQSDASQALHKQPIVLTITEKNEYYLNKELISYDKLEEKLVKSCKGLREPTVVLHAAGTLSVQELVKVMETGARQKIKMVLATRAH
jgi:biopolymer transport protein ExbD